MAVFPLLAARLFGALADLQNRPAPWPFRVVSRPINTV